MQCANCPQLFRFHQRRPTRPLLTVGRRCCFAFPAALLWLLATLTLPSAGQAASENAALPGGDTQAVLRDLQSQVHELKQMVVELKQETVSSRTEITRLREELAAQHGDSSALAAIDQQSPAYTGPAAAQVSQRLDHLEEDQQLLSTKIDTQYQTKVESASKYRIRLSGIVLFNMFGNSGAVDNQDVPTWASRPDPTASSGSVGGTMRQSIIGLEAFGPEVAGARTSANINFDFGGGFPAAYNGVNSGLVRLRTAVVRLDWKDTSLIAGQDRLFIAPESPTSFASLIVPSLSYAGNLWEWAPQLRIEHRFVLANDGKITVQAGFMDPLTGAPPDGSFHYVWYRAPDPGEQSRQPAYAARVGYSRPLFGQTFTVGAAGYYSRQNWGFDRRVNSWAGMMDADVPLGRSFALSGGVYRGAAIGGLGGALGRSVIWNGPLSDPKTEVQPLNTIGGWAQLKFRATPRLEFNGAFGQDSPFAADVRYFGDASQSYAPSFFTTNRGAFGNVIYRPRSDLVFAAEYRRLRTFTIYDSSYEAGQVNMSVGVLF